MSSHDQSVAYHYTIGANFQSIVSHGCLDPAKTSTAGVNSFERPIVWFSADPFWELTANKNWNQDGKITLLTMDETAAKGGGLVRFGYPINKLHSWDSGKLRSKARMPKAIAKGLSEVGIQQGANPSHWYGSLRKIPLQNLTIEVLNDKMQWELVSNTE